MRSPENAESVYNSLSGYAFAKRYAEGKSVAVVCTEGAEYAVRSLADAAESVAVLSENPGASNASAMPNVSYREAPLPKLPYDSESFDVVVALCVIENLDRPEELVAEAKRALKKDGILVVSTADRQAHSNERGRAFPADRSGMYVPDFREMLEKYFEETRLYRHGAVAGGMVFEESGEAAPPSVERVSFYSPESVAGGTPPATDHVIAVCGGEGVAEPEAPYLLLDRDRRVFDEGDELRENVELVRKEVRRMEETEVQAFHETLAAQNAEIQRLRTSLRDMEREATNRKRSLEDRPQKLNDHMDGIGNSRVWKLFTLYRRLRGAESPERRR